MMTMSIMSIQKTQHKTDTPIYPMPPEHLY
jgi:hypothetical protein